MILFSSFLISTITTILLMPILINMASKANILDFPNDRKIHCDPVPRIGGVAIALGALLPIILWTPMDDFVKAILIGSGIVVIFGFIDDVKNIGFVLKLSGQIMAALIVIVYGGIKFKNLGAITAQNVILSDWYSIPITLILIVAVTNAINLSDGLDGLAGGISLLTFLCIGYLAYLNKFQSYEVISVAVIGAIFGLLRYNTHPATVFMGDAGSQLLGFMAITLSLSLTQKSAQLSPILPLLIIGLPIVDTFSVILQRTMEGRSPFTADKNHLHHKLMTLGFYHSESVVLIYIIHATLVCLAFIFRFRSEWFLITIYGLFSGLILAAIYLAEANDWQFKRSPVMDKLIRGRLRTLKEENLIIKFAFKASEIGFIFLLLFTCFLPKHIHVYFSLACLAYLAFIVLIWQLKEEWTSIIIEISIFLIIPFLIYLSETDALYLSNTALKQAYTLSFGVLICFILLTLKFTRRSGFKTTPTDFLILLVALIIPNLPDEKIKSWRMGLIASKIIALFFCYEVLKGELRLNTTRLKVTGIVTLVIIILRGFVG